MDQRSDEAAYPVFVRCGGQRGSSADDKLVSRTALRLHVFAVLASIEAGRPGLITNEYLDAVTAETSLATLELCTAGLWTPVTDHDGTGGDGTGGIAGYRVAEGETMRMAGEVHRQLVELSRGCMRSGGHAADPEHPALCRNCGVQV